MLFRSLGACARFALSGYILQFAAQSRFPWGTFVVNVLGCLVAGLLVGVAEKLHVMSNELRLFLFTGILGGFTTFSAFGVETLHLLRKGELAVAAGYAGLSVACGLAVLWAGWYLVPARAV